MLTSNKYVKRDIKRNMSGILFIYIFPFQFLLVIYFASSKMRLRIPRAGASVNNKILLAELHMLDSQPQFVVLPPSSWT